MAIEFFSTIDLNQNEIQRPVIHNSGTINDNNGILGQLYVHNTQNKLYFHDGTNFIDLTAQGDITGVTLTGGNGITATNTNSSGGAYSSTITLDISDSSLTTETSIAQADLLAFSDESASNDPTKNITFSNLEDQIFSNMNSASSDVAVAAGGAITLANDSVDSAEIADGAVDNVHLSGSIANNKLANSAITIGGTSTSLGGTITALTGLTDLDLTSGNKTIFDGVGSNTLTMGASGTTITIPGNLVVSGTQTVQNETVQIVENNTILFEGTTDDTNEIKLTGGDPTADRVVTLPDATGTVALTSDITGTNSGTNTGDVTLAGSLDYITISNQVITRNAIDLTADVTGTLPTANTAAKVTSIVAGDGIDVNNSGVGDVTVSAEAASSSNAGIVTLASDADAKTGSGTGIISVAQLAARTAVADINSTLVNQASNKSVRLTHSLGTTDLHITIYDPETEKTVYADVSRTTNGSTTSDNDIFIQFGTNLSGNLRAIITAVPGGSSITGGNISYS